MKGSATFHLDKSNIKLGIGFLAAAMVLGVLALLNVPPHFVCWLSIGGLCLIFSLMAFIPCMVVRVRIDYHGIEYRGIKKTYIRWQDAEQIYIIAKRRCAMIYGNGKKITVGSAFDEFGRMIELVEQYAPIEIGNDVTLKKRKINDAMGKTFRKSKFLAVFGFSLLVLALVLILSNYHFDNPFEKLMAAVGCPGLSLYFIKGYYFDKLYVDSDRIVRSSLFRGKTEIKWRDIQLITHRYAKMDTLTIHSSDGSKIRFTSEFKQFNDIEQFIIKFSPVKPIDPDE